MKHKEICRAQSCPDTFLQKIRETPPVRFFGLILPLIFFLTGARKAPAGTADLISHTNDRTWKSTGTVLGSESDPAAGIGTQDSGVSAGFVMPFWIPALNGQEVIGAKLTITAISNELTQTNASVYAEVYGSRSTTDSSTTTAADYTDTTLLVQNWLPLDVNTPPGEHSASNAALTSWINAQAGTNGDCYVFLTVKPNMTSTDLYKYLYIATANATNGGRPQLTLLFGAQENPDESLAANALAVDYHSPVNGPGTNWATAFQTVSAAIASPLFSSSNRNTILIKGGTYRELINLNKSGTADAPLVLTPATTNDRVVISGMKVLDVWTPDSGTVYKNTQMGTNFISNLYADGRRLRVASMPDCGWWASTAQSVSVSSNDECTITFRDTLNLTGLTNDLSGAYVEIWNRTSNIFGEFGIESLAPGTGEIVCSRLSSQGFTSVSGGLFYRLTRHRSFMNCPGEWMVAEEGSTNVIYLNSVSGGAPSGIESPLLPGPLVTVKNQSHIRLDGLEMTGAAQQWNVSANAFVNWNAHNLHVVNAVDIGIYNCIVHSAEKYGMYIRNVRDGAVANCIIRKNWLGMSLMNCTNVSLIGNDIGYNREDSLKIANGCNSCELLGNFIHHTSDEGHSDGLQMGGLDNDPSSYPVNIVLKDNVFLGCGQTIMTAATTGALFKNNMIIGSESFNIAFGHGTSCHHDVLNNTLALSYYSCLNMDGTDYNVSSNVFYNGHSFVLLNTTKCTNYYGSYNWFYPAPRETNQKIFAAADPLTGQKYYKLTFSEFQNMTGQDLTSTAGDPGFNNAPVALLLIDKTKMNLNSTNTLVLAGTPRVHVGDHVEYNFDGILRTVTGTPDSQTIVISPALSESPERGHLVMVWGTNTNNTLDFRAPSTGRGSNLYIPDFQAGDFNSDGVRDIPPMPTYLD